MLKMPSRGFKQKNRAFFRKKELPEDTPGSKKTKVNECVSFFYSQMEATAGTAARHLRHLPLRGKHYHHSTNLALSIKLVNC